MRYTKKLFSKQNLQKIIVESLTSIQNKKSINNKIACLGYNTKYTSKYILQSSHQNKLNIEQI
jgi:hypothetical protein